VGSSPTTAELIDAFLHWLVQPRVLLVSSLAGVMIITFWIGLVYATDRDETRLIRFTGGLLSVISAAIIALGLSALLIA
jgi:hypothetical protein